LQEVNTERGEYLPKIIGFLGTYPADICLYTALSLQNAGKSVCVADNSARGVLYQAIPAPEEKMDIINCRNVDFMRDVPFTDWQEPDYEYVFVVMDGSPQELCLSACEELVLVTDCEKMHLDAYNEFMQERKMSMQVLLRGFCPDGVSGRRLKEYFERENCFIQKWLTLPLDEEDEAYRIRMQYEKIKNFAHISIGMEKVIAQLLRLFLQKDTPLILRAVKAAKQGKALNERQRRMEI